ncbi:MAG TPA: hypothetical protein VG733_16255 [Chthoniobacteraceae bacterium]|nr:hypothetical protein [Chthoniobacteraceae bacterium]
MEPTHIERHFAAMGARFRISGAKGPPFWRRETDYAIDIQKDRHGEFFELRIPGKIEKEIEIDVLQKMPGERHLLLLVRKNGAQQQKDRFLCGHDERSWFVAAVPGNASTVAQAREALKPAEVRAAQERAGVPAEKGYLRKNDAFRRQGEWFFIPEPGLIVDPKRILRNEPVRRGRGKAHVLQEAYRTGGERVYVHDRHANGVLEREYKSILARGNTKPAEWKVMVRNAGVYARGAVRHPDHKTITLHCWHRVHMNTETQTRTMAKVAFLD